MKGKWAKGIAPRFFAWIIKDKLAVSERPGGYARNHRRVRRQEEILWLRGEGFTRVVSLLTSPHNLHAYDELDMAWAHIPFGPHDDPHLVLPDLYSQLRDWMSSGERLLVHQEELSDRLMGVVAGYLRWSGLVPAGPQAITVVERIMHRQMGPDGRELVAMAPQLAGSGGSASTSTSTVARAGGGGEASGPPRESVTPKAAKAPPRESSASRAKATSASTEPARAVADDRPSRTGPDEPTAIAGTAEGGAEAPEPASGAAAASAASAAPDTGDDGADPGADSDPGAQPLGEIDRASPDRNGAPATYDAPPEGGADGPDAVADGVPGGDFERRSG